MIRYFANHPTAANLLMVIGLLGLVLWQGMTTFWPAPVGPGKVVACSGR